MSTMDIKGECLANLISYKYMFFLLHVDARGSDTVEATKIESKDTQPVKKVRAYM